MLKSESRQQTRRPLVKGLGNVLVTVYLVLAIAATARSVFQIIRKFDEAPVAYSLSALAGVVYIVASIALMKHRGVWIGIAWAAIVFELLGVITVGILSITHPELFAHASVWSKFGQGYLYIPLVLPILGIIWLWVAGRGGADTHAKASNRA